MELGTEGRGSLGGRAAGEREEVSVSVVELGVGDADDDDEGHQGDGGKLHPGEQRSGKIKLKEQVLGSIPEHRHFF